MTNSADQSWTHAGHGLPSAEPSLNTTAIATGLQLPAGFSAIAGDPELGPALTTNLARVEKKLEAGEDISGDIPANILSMEEIVELGKKLL